MSADPVALRGRLATRLKAQADQVNARTQVAYHGAGPTFGELAIGECFYWPPPIPRGPDPMVKSAEDRYQFKTGYGKAEPYYRVERWTEGT